MFPSAIMENFLYKNRGKNTQNKSHEEFLREMLRKISEESDARIVPFRRFDAGMSGGIS